MYINPIYSPKKVYDVIVKNFGKHITFERNLYNCEHVLSVDSHAITTTQSKIYFIYKKILVKIPWGKVYESAWYGVARISTKYYESYACYGNVKYTMFEILRDSKNRIRNFSE